MRFYLFVACMVTTHLVFDLVKSSSGLHGFFSITNFGLNQFLPGSLCAVYCGIFVSHSAMLKKKYNIYGFSEENAPAGSTLPSPPRDIRSFLSITMSFLKTNLYLFVLGLALMGIDNLLTTHSIPHRFFALFLCPILYFLGFFLYTYKIFHYRTNVMMLIICLHWALTVYFPLLAGLSAQIFTPIYKWMLPGLKTTGEIAVVTSEVPSLTGAFSSSVETGSRENLETHGNCDAGKNDGTANQPDEPLVAITAPGIIHSSSYSCLE
jgi:hypothetical protein